MGLPVPLAARSYQWVPVLEPIGLVELAAIESLLKAVVDGRQGIDPTVGVTAVLDWLLSLTGSGFEGLSSATSTSATHAATGVSESRLTATLVGG